MHIDELVLDRCIHKAWRYQTLTLPNPAVGAAVYDESYQILSLEAHQKAGLPHAEVLALFWAFAALVAREQQGGQNIDGVENIEKGQGVEKPQNLKAQLLQALAPHWERFQRECDKGGGLDQQRECSEFGRQDKHGDFSNIALADLPTNSAAIHAFLRAMSGGRFAGKTLILTLEPCNHTGKTPPCAALIAALGLKRVVIAARDEWGESAGGAEYLQAAARESGQNLAVEFFTSAPLLQKAQELLYPFLAYRKAGEFCVFKLASRLDGDYKSGQISGQESQEFTHNQRAIAASIIISGATARADRPRLDTRYAGRIYGTNPPDVGIFTRDPASIDRSIPLFDQSLNRAVRFYNAQNFLHNFAQDLGENLAPDSIKDSCAQGFYIIEGGVGLFATLSAIKRFSTMPKLLLLHLSSTLANTLATSLASTPLDSNNQSTESSLHESSSPESKLPESLTRFTLLHTTQLGEDLLLWLKP